jgi:hypothetical protein
MKQSDANKLVNNILKVQGKQLNWKFSSGYLFIKRDLLFFVLLILPNAKNRKVSFSLNYKLYDFDEVFWNLVDLSENINMPLSFHASGAWSAPTMQIYNGVLEIEDWQNESMLTELVSNTIQNADKISLELSRNINNIDKNLEYIESLHTKHLEEYPDSKLDIFKEQLMTAILKHDYLIANKMADSRINLKESGGFMVGNKSFYEMTQSYLHDFLKKV